MDLQKLTAEQLHIEAERAAKHVASAAIDLFRILEVVEEKKIYLEFGFSSLFRYCTEVLKVSSGVSYELIAVIRKSIEVPELREAFASGKVSLSKAKKICSVINSKNHLHWIDLAQTETSRVIEKCVAMANPKEVVSEASHYVAADRLELRLGVSEEFMESLAKLKDLLSQKSNGVVDSEGALLTVMREYIAKHDPIQKAERAVHKKYGLDYDSLIEKEQVPGLVASSHNARKPIKRITIHNVVLRDQYQCTFVGRHGRCGEKRWLDIHHTVPVAAGGTNNLENLALLCRSHHRMLHRG